MNHNVKSGPARTNSWRTRGFRGPGAVRHNLTVLTVAVLGGLWLGAAERVAAQEVPPGCNFAGAGASTTRFPPTNVVHGQEICYRVSYNNGVAGVNCEIRNFEADFFFPDGSSIQIFDGVTILSGEAVICPSADPRCETASNCGIAGQEGYSYIVSHADEVDSFNGCPPVTVPGTGRVVAYTEGNGDSLTNPPDAAAACATANNIVPHACCEPCTGECIEVASPGECMAPSTYTPDQNCNELDPPCSPLLCPGPVPPCEAGQVCNPDTGMCMDNPDAPLSTPCDTCAGGDTDCNNCHCDGNGACVDNPDPLSTPCETDDSLCTPEHCDGNGACVPNGPPIMCAPGTPPCEGGEVCNPDTGMCEDNPDAPLSTVCELDDDLCTPDHCDGDGLCVPNGPPVTCDNPDCQVCVPETGECVDIDPPPMGCDEDFAGCTPGFWKQPHHEQYWVGYTTGDFYDTVFGVTSSFGGDFTLLDALWQGGGGEIALGRHAVAALLNSTRPDVVYFYSTQEVIDLVQAAYATGDFNGIKNQLAAQNELGCTVVKRPENNTSVLTPQEKKTIRSGR